MQTTNTIQVSLTNKDQWQTFGPDVEMSVTKGGKCLVPSLELGLTGLNLHSFYKLALRLELVDNYRYKFKNGAWFPAGFTEPVQNKGYNHPGGLQTGRYLMTRPVSFSKLKINNRLSTDQTEKTELPPDYISVRSLHKYIPVLTIEKDENGVSELVGEFKLDMATFIAVTGYKKEGMAELKKTFNSTSCGGRKRLPVDVAGGVQNPKPPKVAATSPPHQPPQPVILSSYQNKAECLRAPQVFALPSVTILPQPKQEPNQLPAQNYIVENGKRFFITPTLEELNLTHLRSSQAEVPLLEQYFQRT